jgi:RHS repeat-associated protein
VEYFYDDASKNYCKGRLSKIIDQSGSTEFFYDNLGREIKSIKTVNTTSYTVNRAYDALDRLTALTYPDGEVVYYSYNNAGSLEKVYTQDAQHITHDYVSNIDYSATGQIIKIQYGNGAETNYTYNPQTLRLTNLTTQSSQGRVQDLNYQFDNVGNIKNITDGVNTATQSFTYDDLNRLIQAQGGYGVYNYAYDSIGNMTSKEGVNLTYGKLGKLPHAVTQYGSTSIDYDANGNMLKKGNLELTYDTENRLTKVEDTSNSAPISATLALQPGWNLVSFPVLPQDKSISSVLAPITGKFDQVSRYNSQAQAFEHYVGNSKYDQFTTFDYNTGYQIYVTSLTPVTLTVTGTYLESKTIQLKETWNFIGANHLSQPVTQALKDIAFSSLLRYNKDTGSFDSYPAFTEIEPGQAYYLKVASSQAWVITNSAPATTFTYDGDGGRVSKSLIANGISQSTTYIGSLFEKDSDGSLRKHIFAGPNRVCTLTQDAGHTTQEARYFHSDHLGSSNVITDSTGAQVAFTEFTPYGSTFRQTGSYDPHHKFTGKELDSSTGLYFYGARYYDPQLGRFISADTIVQSPYDPQSLNRYSYCRNNPINLVDPTGHWWFIVAAIIKFAVAHPIIFGAITGALTNTAFNASQIHNFGNFMSFAGIGAVSGGIFGGVSSGVGGIVGKGLGAFWGNLAGAAAGGLTGGFAGSFGNALYGGTNFGDALGFAGQTALLTAGISTVTAGATYGISKVVGAIRQANAQARAAGVKTPVGQQGQGSAAGSLNTNKGEAASGTQALSSRGTQSEPDVIHIRKPAAELEPIKAGEKVYRVWGDGAGAEGRSWTNVNPETVPNFRAGAGLPPQNTGRFVTEGRLIDTTGVITKPAESIYGNPGGLQEVVIPDPKNQVQIERVSGANPEY